jgi:hypothetical protein
MKVFQQLITTTAVVLVAIVLFPSSLTLTSSSTSRNSNSNNFLFVAAQDFDRQADNNEKDVDVDVTTEIVDDVDADDVDVDAVDVDTPTSNNDTDTDTTDSPTLSPTTASPTDYFYGEDVPFRAFVENTSRDIPASAEINGLYLTLGASIDNSNNNGDVDGDGSSSSLCLIDSNAAGQYVGMMHNVMHTIEPVYFNETTNTAPSITVSSYPEGLIQGIIFGIEDIEFGGNKFLRLVYNEDMLLLSTDDIDDTNYDDDYYGVWIQFPAEELNEIHLGGDIKVEVKEGFTNMTLLRATDRVTVDMSYDGHNTNTFNVRSSQTANVVLDIGHYTDPDYYDDETGENKKIKVIASDSSLMMISGTVETIECVNNAMCIVDGKIISEECNDSLVAMNATLETDDCSCVTINAATSDTSITATTRVVPLFDENYGASCVDTTYIPPVIAKVDGPAVTNTVFSCPPPLSEVEEVVIVPSSSEEKEEDTLSSISSGEEEFDMSTNNNDTTTSTTNIEEEVEVEGQSPSVTSGSGSYLDDQNIAIVWENNGNGSSSSHFSPSLCSMTTIAIMISATMAIIAIF